LGVWLGLVLAVLGAAGELKDHEAEDYYDEEGSVEQCLNKIGFFPDSGQCDKYYQCKGGKLTSHLCPDGLVYDSSHYIADFQLDSSGTTGKCSYPFSIDCTGRETLQMPNPIPSDECPRKNGYFSHLDCDKYYLCNDGVANLINCPVGLVFAPDKGGCTWIQEANRPGCKSEDKSEFICPKAIGYPRYPDPVDCQKFYICISGSAHHNSCPNGQIFHPLNLVCDSQESTDGPCNSWYNKTSVDGLTLADPLPTSAKV